MRLTKINEIIKDVESGLSTDAIIGNHVNRRTDNVDDIIKVIRDYKWRKRNDIKNVDINVHGGTTCLRALRVNQGGQNQTRT